MPRELVRLIFGSHLYGTATPQSDMDVKAVHVPNPGELILGRSSKVISEKTKENPQDRNTSEDIDFESFSLHQFIKLLIDAQPVALEMLFAPKSAILNSSKEWEWLVTNRASFVSKKSDTFLGYARQQVQKFVVKGERVAAVEEMVRWLNSQYKPGLILENLEWESIPANHGNLIEFKKIKLDNGYLIDHLSVCGRMVPFGTKVGDAIAIYNKLYSNYGKRTRAAHETDGVDWKGMSHAVRVASEGVELLCDGMITLPSPSASYLLAIKTGEIPLEKVTEQIETLFELLEEMSISSVLQEEPNKNLLDRFLLTVYHNEIKNFIPTPKESIVY